MSRRWDIFNHRPGVKTFDLAPGAFALALMVKYFILMSYGTTAAIFLIPSFTAVGGPVFALTWAIAIAFSSAFALVGTVRTWYTCHPRLELWSIATLVLTFLAYSIVVVVRGILMDNWDSIAVAWLPLGFSFLPAIRYYSLISRRDDE